MISDDKRNILYAMSQDEGKESGLHVKIIPLKKAPHGFTSQRYQRLKRKNEL
ncbi:hypothetical protein [Candidatus Nitrosocosmicus oleophilus]|uniref:hypothetical protein n=1 Tax=Candidatus Nitrosocosmicus oleophilus TaxID=1353260 RepID=UPI0018C96229|nr:hypothetical protein [Candidatus Nitrosocosmicus oleophilus]